MESSIAPNGMVSTIDMLATNAGVSMLQAGGSAVDAAIAANAVLAVTTQNQCGLGGDLFALVHVGEGPPAVLNASGRAGSGASAEKLRSEGHSRIPERGHPSAVPVPGCVDGWLLLHERFGALDLRNVLGPAILYAENGFPVSDALAAASSQIAHLATHDFAGIRAGQRLVRPGIARVLRSIVTDGRDGFYGGEFGDGLQEVGNGEYDEHDLDQLQAGWVTPLVREVFGHDVWTTPPNSQGYLTLAGLDIVQGLDLPMDTRDPLWAHLMIEAARAAAFDRGTVLHEKANGDELLSADRISSRRDRINPDTAVEWGDSYGDGGTIYLNAVDANGMGVSLIQSNARAFGSYLTAGDTGIFLHNRGIGFSLVPDHPAEYGPGRQPPHTLSPALITNPDGSLRAVLGTMGGDAQPHVVQQLATRLLHHGQTPGEVITAGRFVLGSSDPTTMFSVWERQGRVRVLIEPWLESAWRAGLEARGHEVVVSSESNTFGHAHCIDVGPDGILLGRSDPRAPGGAASGY
jgi:gamma-glutamyltranspeptidase/glutathione hydrolase